METKHTKALIKARIERYGSNGTENRLKDFDQKWMINKR